MPRNTPESNEEQRLAALKSYNILDTATEQDYEELTELAAAICGTPIGLISLVDENRQWFKSHLGLPISETHRSQSFCAHAINQPHEIMEVENAHQDERFKDNPLVIGNPHITFYAGMPLVDEGGHALGSLCVIDQKPRKLTASQQKALRTLAKQVVTQLTLRRKVKVMTTSAKRIKRLNELLTQAEQQAHEIIDHMPMAAAVHTGEEMVIRSANPLMLAAWGKDAAVLNQPFNQALPELAAMDFPYTMRRVLQTGVPYERKEAHMSFMHEGELREFYYDYAFTPLTDKEGRIWGILNTAVDITANVTSRLKQQQAEDLFRMSVSSANMGTWHLDAKNNHLTASDRTKELFGYLPSEEMPLDAAITQITDEHRDRVRQAIDAAVNAGQAYDLEYPIIGHRDQKLRWVRATGRLYAKEDGSMTDFAGTLLDITERKLTEERKNDFIGIVSHELRSPLTAMNGYIQMLDLKAKKQQDESISLIAGKAKRQVDRMRVLITGFLDAARMNEGKLQLNRRPFDMATLIKIAEEESLATVSSHHLIFHPVEHIMVNADQDKIEQVLVNYINNAVKYSPPQTTIQVSCVMESGLVKVCVKDEGMGLAPQDSSRVFERFYRVESESMKNTKGFGIGLYLCRELIELHGGQVGVDSILGQGSYFWFILPLHTLTKPNKHKAELPL